MYDIGEILGRYVMYDIGEILVQYVFMI